MNNAHDATYQIARATLVDAYADTILAGMDYAETLTKGFRAEVEAKVNEILGERLNELKAAITPELIEGAPTVFERGEECAS